MTNGIANGTGLENQFGASNALCRLCRSYANVVPTKQYQLLLVSTVQNLLMFLLI